MSLCVLIFSCHLSSDLQKKVEDALSSDLQKKVEDAQEMKEQQTVTIMQHICFKSLQTRTLFPHNGVSNSQLSTLSLQLISTCGTNLKFMHIWRSHLSSCGGRASVCSAQNDLRTVSDYLRRNDMSWRFAAVARWIKAYKKNKWFSSIFGLFFWTVEDGADTNKDHQRRRVRDVLLSLHGSMTVQKKIRLNSIKI